MSGFDEISENPHGEDGRGKCCHGVVGPHCFAPTRCYGLDREVSEDYPQRYYVAKRTSGFWPYCVKEGDGERELFTGYKSQCELVARRLNNAFDLGAHVHTPPNPGDARLRAQAGDFQDKALAWDAVCEILHIVHPNWHANGRTGLQAAVLTIQKISGPACGLREMAHRWRESANGAKQYATTDYESGCAAEQKRCADELLSLLDGKGVV